MKEGRWWDQVEIVFLILLVMDPLDSRNIQGKERKESVIKMWGLFMEPRIGSTVDSCMVLGL